MDAQELLAHATQLFASTKAEYRDGMISVGRTLIKYVRAFLARGDGLSEHQRIKRSINRQAAIMAASDALKCKCPKINELIRLGAAYELLAPPGGFGGLSFSCVRALRVLIERPNRGKNRRSRTEDEGDELLPFSSLEEWVIRPGYQEQARTLVAEAIQFGWGEADVKKAVRVLLHAAPLKQGQKYQTSFSVRYGDRSGLLEEALVCLLADDDPHGMLDELKGLLERVRTGTRTDPYQRERNLRQYSQAVEQGAVLFEGVGE